MPPGCVTVGLLDRASNGAAAGGPRCALKQVIKAIVASALCQRVVGLFGGRAVCWCPLVRRFALS